MIIVIMPYQSFSSFFGTVLIPYTIKTIDEIKSKAYFNTHFLVESIILLGNNETKGIAKSNTGMLMKKMARHE